MVLLDGLLVTNAQLRIESQGLVAVLGPTCSVSCKKNLFLQLLELEKNKIDIFLQGKTVLIKWMLQNKDEIFSSK